MYITISITDGIVKSKSPDFGFLFNQSNDLLITWFCVSIVWEEETQSSISGGSKEKGNEEDREEDGCSGKRKSLGRKVDRTATAWGGKEGGNVLALMLWMVLRPTVLKSYYYHHILVYNKWICHYYGTAFPLKPLVCVCVA